MFRDLAQIGLRERHAPVILVDFGQQMNSERSKLVNEIYSADPATGVPRNDIGVFFSPNTSPEVRQHIEQLIMKRYDNPSAPLSASDFEQLDDKATQAIMDSMPEPDETLEQFEARVMVDLDNQRHERQVNAAARKLRKKLNMD